MRQTKSNENPSVWQAVGNGSYLYRFNIEEKEESLEPSKEGGTIKVWVYNEVTVWMPITANSVTESVMNAMWDKDVEQKMLNDYNAAQLGILGSEYVDKYKTFLSERKALKEQIDIDFETYRKEA